MQICEAVVSNDGARPLLHASFQQSNPRAVTACPLTSEIGTIRYAFCSLFRAMVPTAEWGAVDRSDTAVNSQSVDASPPSACVTARAIGCFRTRLDSVGALVPLGQSSTALGLSESWPFLVPRTSPSSCCSGGADRDFSTLRHNYSPVSARLLIPIVRKDIPALSEKVSDGRR